MTQAWYPDPGGRHQYRYWDGQVWTDHVSDNGQATVDPLPPPPANLPTMSERMHQAREWSDQRMRDAAAAMYRRNAHHQGRDVPVLNSMDAVSVLGPWSGVAGAVSNYAASASGLADVLPVLRALMGSSEAQAEPAQTDRRQDRRARPRPVRDRTHAPERSRTRRQRGRDAARTHPAGQGLLLSGARPGGLGAEPRARRVPPRRHLAAAVSAQGREVLARAEPRLGRHRRQRTGRSHS